MYLDMGYIKTSAASPRMKVADVDYNVDVIIEVLNDAKKKNVSFVCFPELCITGYTCGDLFLQNTLQKVALDGLKRIVASNIDVTAIVVLKSLMEDLVPINLRKLQLRTELLRMMCLT